VNLPAAGFGMGDVVLAELLKERGLASRAPAGVEVFLAAVTEDDLPYVLRLAHELRDGGLAVEYALSPQPLGKQLKLADARGARLAVVVGPDDRARGEVILKDLRAKAQQAVRHDRLTGEIRAALSSEPVVEDTPR
jgi:histidyl-tRNA synthetase